MLERQLSTLITGLVTPFLRDRRRAMEGEFAEIQAKASSLGAGMGSGVVVMSFNAAATELDHRVGFIWGAMKRVLQSGRVELYDGLAQDLEGELQQYRDPVMKDLVDRLTKLAERNRMTLSDRLDIKARWPEAVEKFRGEAELELFGVRREASLAGQTSITFHGPVGAFQSGPSSIAHVTQTVNSHAIGELQAILDEIGTVVPLQSAGEDVTAKLQTAVSAFT